MGRLIDVVVPYMGLIPDVVPPPKQDRDKSDNDKILDKLLWTVLALAVYLMASQIPLYGITPKSGSDTFYIMRMILASNKNTLMELGISPIITSGMILQLLSGAKIIDINLGNEKDRKLFSAAQKLFGLVLTVAEAVAYVLAGNYGDVATLGVAKCILIVAQLITAGVIVLLLDDLLGKGYGLGGGGVNLFIVTNICEAVIWGCFSTVSYANQQMEGAILNFVQQVIFNASGNRMNGLRNAFFRENAPNMMNILATVVVFLLVIYIQGFQYTKLMIRPSAVHNRGAAQTQAYPIKLFYTSNMPIILLSALMSQVYFFSQILYRRYGKDNRLIELLGRWEEGSDGRSRPVGGLSYLISPPDNFVDALTNPIRFLFYVTFMFAVCALLAVAWIEISGASPHHVQASFEEQGVEVVSVNKAKGKQELKRVIRTAAALGGICVAALSITADLAGAIGSGTGILLAVTTIYEMASKVFQAQKQSAAAKRQ